jgi:AcrR family transcriptional regulator
MGRASGQPARASGRDDLLDAAERLFATRGVHGVSLRQIGAEAGARNNSAAQYHFGDRAGLLRAIFERRMGPIDEQRRSILASDPEPDLALVVRALVEPLASAVSEEPEGSWYVRFLDELLREASIADLLAVEQPYTSGLRRTFALIDERLADRAPLEREQIVELAIALAIRGFADFERKRDRGLCPPGLTVDVVAELIAEGGLGVLCAQPSEPVTATA